MLGFKIFLGISMLLQLTQIYYPIIKNYAKENTLGITIIKETSKNMDSLFGIFKNEN